MKRVGIRGFSGIQYKCEKIGTRKTPNTDTFYTVKLSEIPPLRELKPKVSICDGVFFGNS